jgi:DNA-binding NarL/FixJ family response regulator
MDFSRLSPRERLVIALSLYGTGLMAIASMIGVTKDTAWLHRSRAFKKLGVRSQTELMLACRERY